MARQKSPGGIHAAEDKTQASRFDPPAFLPDFDEGQRVAWDALLRSFFKDAIDTIRTDVLKGGGDLGQLTLQYFDPTSDSSPLLVQPITWNAFPKELLVRYGRDRAMFEADQLWPLAAYRAPLIRPYRSDAPGELKGARSFETSTVYRPQVEYCEWHVARDPGTGAIARVTLTSEPPEYWIAMFGGRFPGTDIVFPDGREKVLALYREWISPMVQMEDLIAVRDDAAFSVARGGYDPRNKWNTTHGAVHLTAPPNSLAAEVILGAEATIRRISPAGAPITEPSALACCAGFGGVNRNSDPTIGASVNALARLGAMVTLPNPVGLYMDHIDLAGWRTPDGSPAAGLVKIMRGSPGLIERMTVEAPPGSGFSLGDVTIGGEAILHGGQVAECVTVKLNGGARGIGSVPRNVELGCTVRCLVDRRGSAELMEVPIGAAPVPGMEDCFGAVPRAAPQMTADRLRSEAAQLAVPLRPRRSHR